MITVLGGFFLTALCFAALSQSGAGLWAYYVPASLVVVLLWMHAVDLRNRFVARRIVRGFPDLLPAEEREMLLASPSLFIPRLDSQPVIFSGRDLTGIVQTAAAVAGIYAVLAALRHAPIPALLSAGISLYSLLGPLANAFESSNRADSMARAVDRCVSRVRRRKRGDAQVSQEIGMCYWTILDKISLMHTPVADSGREDAS